MRSWSGPPRRPWNPGLRDAEAFWAADPHDQDLVPLSQLPFDEVAAFDRSHFGAPRDDFLRRWIDPDGGIALAMRENDRILGIGVARPCRDGFKIGPLFAEHGLLANRILRGLSRVAVGEPIFLDVPDCNPAALALAERYEMKEVFRCARMYLESPPELPWREIFGVTTLELG